MRVCGGSARLHARVIKGAGDAHGQRRRRLALHLQVRQHVAHQALVDERGAERVALGRVVQRLCGE